MLNVDKVYIPHWSKLKERKEYLKEHLQSRGILEYSFVEHFDKETWNVEDVKNEYPNVFSVDKFGRKLNLSEISLLLKYCWIIKDSHKNQYDSILILEDDVELHPDFVELFNTFKGELPEDWDIAWVGSCLNLHAPATPNKHVYRAQGSRCTHAFAINKCCIEKIVKEVTNFCSAADHQFNTLIEQLHLNNFWFEPSIAEQNKSSEIFNTSVHYSHELDL